jgi:hypothetical protein
VADPPEAGICDPRDLSEAGLGKPGCAVRTDRDGRGVWAV